MGAARGRTDDSMMASMSRRTRYVALASGGVLAAGLCSGLVAYMNRDPARGAAAVAPAELAFVPSNAVAVAYADVRAVMASGFLQRLRRVAPVGADREQLERRLGLRLEHDIDRVLVFWAPGPEAGAAASPAPGPEEDAAAADPAPGPEADAAAADPAPGGSGLALFAGRFDAARLEAAARDGGAAVSEENGVRIVSLDVDGVGSLAMAFLAPGLAAVGDLAAVRRAARRGAGGRGVVSDEAMMRLLGRVDTRSSAWAVGRFTDSGLSAWVPESVSERLPAVTAFAVEGRIDDGIAVSLTVEGRDDQAAQNLRDVVRGLVALARLQSLGTPELQAILDSLETGGVGTAVTLSFHLPGDALDLLLSMAPPADPS